MGGGHRLSLPSCGLGRVARHGTTAPPVAAPGSGIRRPSRGGDGTVAWQTVTSHGGRSSARLERQVVALEAGGSSPLAHPNRSGGVRGARAPRTLPGRSPGSNAPLAQRQSSGLLIHWFRVRIPGGAPALSCSDQGRCGGGSWSGAPGLTVVGRRSWEECGRRWPHAGANRSPAEVAPAADARGAQPSPRPSAPTCRGTPPRDRSWSVRRIACQEAGDGQGDVPAGRSVTSSRGTDAVAHWSPSRTRSTTALRRRTGMCAGVVAPATAAAATIPTTRGALRGVAAREVSDAGMGPSLSVGGGW